MPWPSLGHSTGARTCHLCRCQGVRGIYLGVKRVPIYLLLGRMYILATWTLLGVARDGHLQQYCQRFFTLMEKLPFFWYVNSWQVFAGRILHSEQMSNVRWTEDKLPLAFS